MYNAKPLTNHPSPRTRSFFRSVYFHVLEYAYLSLCFCISAVLVFTFDRVIDEVGVLLGIGGVIFGAGALIDAHKAFETSSEVAEAVGSFKLSFKDLLEEIARAIRNARKELILLIPTPAYGFLFDQQALSREIVEGLETFTQKQGTQLTLVLVLGETAKDSVTYMPQRYLRRASVLDSANQGNAHFIEEEYVRLVQRIFNLEKALPKRVTIQYLRTDPNVRIVVADPQEFEGQSRISVFSIAQSSPERLSEAFESKGFSSRRVEMVDAHLSMIQLYLREYPADTSFLSDISSFFTIHK